MNLASAFANLSNDEIKALLDGGSLTIYSVARPISADLPVEFSGSLAVLHFRDTGFRRSGRRAGNPAFDGRNRSLRAMSALPASPAPAKADGTVVADFSVGPGDREIKLGEVSCSPGAPVKVVAFKFKSGRRLAGASRLLQCASAPRLFTCRPFPDNSAIRAAWSWAARVPTEKGVSTMATLVKTTQDGRKVEVVGQAITLGGKLEADGVVPVADIPNRPAILAIAPDAVYMAGRIALTAERGPDRARRTGQGRTGIPLESEGDRGALPLCGAQPRG